MQILTCPLCADKTATHVPLKLTDKTLRCANNHCFDLAKEGYVNLLPVQKKKSKQPGDSPEMIQARRAFLNAGHYQCLADTLKNILQTALEDAPSESPVVVDLGCGEGYYTRSCQSQCDVESNLKNLAPKNHTLKNHALYGIDISKTAIRYAAKQNAQANYVVANAFQLPFADNSVDIILQVYAYANPAEVKRVLKPHGRYIIVSPAANHLHELKARIYDTVQPHKPADIPDGFEHINTQRLTDTITPDNDARTHLLKMTPFYWAASKEKQTELDAAEPFAITLDFAITQLQ